jgi:hypothetical protein
MLSAALELVRYLRRSGAELDVEDSNLEVTAPAGVLTEEIKQELVARTGEVLVLFTEAIQLLNERGVRLISPDGKRVAMWRDADGREVRDALDAIGLGDAKVEHLENPDADIAERYRQFIPKYVEAIWSRQGLLATPTERLLAETKARRINAFFNSLGPAYRTKGVTAATVLHGLLAAKKKAAQE